MHKEGKYLKWNCGKKYSKEERHKLYELKMINCISCGNKATKKYCNKCYYKFNTHYLKGKKLPKWWCKRISEGQGKQENNVNWKGENAGYWTKHKWMVKVTKNPPKCEDCGVKGKKNLGGRWTIQWANISGLYKRDIKDYKGLCTKCHSKFDGLTKSIDDYKHGSVGRYRRGCKCELCIKAKSLHRKGLLGYSEVYSKDCWSK